MSKVVNNSIEFVKNKRNLPIILLSYVLLLGYILPTAIYGELPYGTDAFTHLVYTQVFTEANSLNEFYSKCQEKGYIGYDYPFGLWLFGSIVSKITGVGSITLSLLVPFACLLILILLYFEYSKLFSDNDNEAGIFSVLFLLSTPSIVMGVLGYSTSIFSMFLIVTIVYFMLDDKIGAIKRFLIMAAFVFFLSITHTGTYLFMIFFSMTFFVVYAAVTGKMHKESYFLTIAILVFYIFSMHIFPEIHSQFVGKGRILVSIGESLSIAPFLTTKQITDLFYSQILVKLSVPFTVLLLSFLFLVGYMMAQLNRIFLKLVSDLRLRQNAALVPVGFVTTISHAPIFWPIWLGPVNVILAAIGILKTRKPLIVTLVISIAIITIPSGALAGERALRELFYMFLVVPVLSSVGYIAVGDILKKIEKPRIRKGIAAFTYFVVFLSIITIPVVGNLYYHPDISGKKYEIDSIKWLAGVGSSGEGAVGPLGSRVAVYGNKIPVDVLLVPAGAEMSRLGKEEFYTYFKPGSESDTKDLLASFGISYLITTDKIFRLYGQTPLNLSVDSNTQLDKIYSTINYVSIYRQIPSKVKRADIFPQINFDENVTIKDAGGNYLVDTGWYKVRLSKETPEIQYIGNKTVNYLDEGGFADIVSISLIDPDHTKGIFGLHELTYSEIILGKNQIIYKTKLRSETGKDLATLIVKYTFFERAFKREITVANDWGNSYMRVGYTARIYSPLDMFTIRYEDKQEKRQMYPNDDYVLLEDTKFSEMYIHHNAKGILIKYGETAPYPNKILYTGSVIGYYMVDQIVDLTQNQLSPAESVQITQWMSVGDEGMARNNTLRYSISLYPYPNGIKPLVLISYLGSLSSVSESKLSVVKYVHSVLKQHQVQHYFEIVKINDRSKLKVLENITDDVLYSADTFEMSNITANEGIGGIFPEDLVYDLESVKQLDKAGVDFIFSKEVPPPFYIYWKEGQRIPHSAFVEGKELSTILLPISKPTIEIKKSRYPKTGDFLNVIDAAAKYESLVVFRWDSMRLNDSKLLNSIINILGYAKSRGLTITTPEEIVNHYKLLKNVSVNVYLNESGQILIKATNKNNVELNGLTFKVEVPNNVELSVENAKILYVQKDLYYISTDLGAGESKIVKLFFIKNTLN